MALSNNRFELTGSSPPPQWGSENSIPSELTPDVEEQLLLLLDLLGESDLPELGSASRLESGVDAQIGEASPLRLLPPARLPASEGEIVDVTFCESSPRPNSAPQETENLEQQMQEATPIVEHQQPAVHLEQVQQEATSIVEHQQPAVHPEPATYALIETTNPTRTIPHSEDDLLIQLQGLLVGSQMAQAEEKVTQLNQQLAEIENLITEPAALIELLLPVVAELLERKVQLSQEEMCRALFPLIDKMIYQRAQQDRAAVSAALADVIPAAIAQELQSQPEAIVSAIAPAMGAAIKEQIRLDRNSVIVALAPEMGRAIKHQIEIERDAMVDALYPVVGSTVKRYIAEAIQEINHKIANALSVEGIKRKIRAKVQGVSEAELIFQESMPAKVQAVFLIHKASGLVISQAHQSDVLHLDADMIGGMLTAIRSFVNDCIAQSGSESELNEIEYGDSKILLEVAGYCYLAVVIQGEPPRSLIERIRDTLSHLIQKYGDPIEQFDGDPDTIPELIHPRVENLMDVEMGASVRRGFPGALVGAIAAGAIALILPLGFYLRQQSANRQLERATLSALYRAPALSVYHFSTAATQKVLTLQGRVESEFLRSRAEAIARSLAPERHIDNQILVVEVPPDPARVAAEVKRIESLFQEEPGTDITAHYEILPSSGELPVRGKVAIAGTVNSTQTQQRIVKAFAAIPGVATVSSGVVLPSTDINARIYFKNNSAQLEAIDRATKIKSIVRHLEQYSDLHLKIIGYSPTSEQGNSSQRAIARATAVRTALIEQGIATERLEVQGIVGSPSDVRPDTPGWLSQCVRFEAIAPTSTPTVP